MPIASDVKPDSRFFGMFVSRSAGGKSCAAMTFKRENERGQVLDFDLRKGYVNVPFLDLQHWNIKSFPPISTYYIDVEKEIEGLYNLYTQRQWPYDTIIIDALPSLLRILLTDSVELSVRGATKGGMKLSGPADYNYQSQTILQFFDYIRSLPCNVIVNCMLGDKWGPGTKRDREGKLIEYQDDEVIGEELVGITNKLSVIIPGYFDEIYKFSRDPKGEKFYVEFYTDLARSIYKMPRGKIDITGKRFYEVWLNLVKGEKADVVANTKT